MTDRAETCSGCRYFILRGLSVEIGLCDYAHIGANVRDWTRAPKRPEDHCSQWSVRAFGEDERDKTS